MSRFTTCETTYTCDRCGASKTLRDQEDGMWPAGWCWIETGTFPECGHACPSCAAKMERVGTEFVTDYPAMVAARSPRLSLIRGGAA